MQRETSAKAVEADHKAESNASIGRDRSPAVSTHPILALHQLAGNRAVGRMLQAKLRDGAAVQRKQIAGGTRATTTMLTDSLAAPDHRSRVALASENFGPIQRKCCETDDASLSVPDSPAHSPCPTCEEQIQRKPSGATALREATPLLPAGPGAQIAPAVRASFEAAFEHDFSSVRLHTGPQAGALAHARNALAYTTGHNIVFGEGYEANSSQGRHLLAHELTHVVQQRQHGAAIQSFDGESDALEREADYAADRAVSGQLVGKLQSYSGALPQRKESTPDEPIDCTMTASLDGFYFHPVPGEKLQAGRLHPQLLAMVLKKLLGDAYTAAFRDKVMNAWGGGKRPIFGVGEEKATYTADEIAGREVKEGEKAPWVFWYVLGFDSLLDVCARLGQPVKLPPDKQRLLELGKVAAQSYDKLDFPKWFSKELYTAVMSSRAALLSGLQQAMKEDMPDGQGSMSGPKAQKALAAIESSLAVSVYAVDAIRDDPALVEHLGYKMLWPPLRKKGEKEAAATAAPIDRVPDISSAAGLIAYADARPKLADKAIIDPATRKKLLGDFVVASGHKQVNDPSKGDQPLLEYPTQFTAPPYPSTLSIYPGPESGLYGSTRGEYGFTMALEFPDVFAAFQFHQYDFTAFRVADDKLISAAAALKGPGRKSSHWQTLKGRLARDERYHEADVKAYADTLWDQFGPPGKAADLVHLNALMRELGTVVGTAIETIFDPSYLARFDFPDEGLYIVRCRAAWDPGQEVTLRRPPSVAYQPIFARDPEVLAEVRLQGQLEEERDATARLAEINKLLEKKSLSADHRKELEDEKARLQAATGGVEAMLNYQMGVLGKSSDKDAAERVEKLKEILGTRTKRGFGKDTTRLPGVYVNDAGQMIDLLLELRVISEDVAAGTGEYEVNDATTPSSTSAKASGKRHDAIVQALTKLFKDSDYGRGKASVRVDGVLAAIDIPTVSPGKLFIEALGHVSTILSVIAIAAAPFTGGASMALMVPAMIIGAVPSAYNIIHRGIDHTLHADLALAMDIVNVVGALVGVGAETRAGMQAIRLGTTGGRVIIVTGLGAMGTSVLLMSVGVARQIDALQDMPEGLRRAELMKILGHFMLNAGIMVGGILASQARARASESGPHAFEDWMAQLDQDTRERIEASKGEVEPVKNFWKIYSEMNPSVRDLLTQCGSSCVPMDPPPSQRDVARIEKLATDLSPGARRRFKGLLHENRLPAAMDKVLTAIEDSASKATRSKLDARKASAAARTSAVEYAIWNLATHADYILAEFTEEAVRDIDRANPDPAKWGRVRKLANEVGEAGKIPLATVADVLDRVRNIQGGDPEEILGLLKKLGTISGKAEGIERILGKEGLSGNFKFFKGARWALRFLRDSGLWDSVKGFEELTVGHTLERVVDIRLVDGTRIELKSWSEWVVVGEVKAAAQLMEDFISTAGFSTEPVQWRFEPGEGIGDAKGIIANMERALDIAVIQKRYNFNDPGAPNRVAQIKRKLPQIIKVGAQ